VAEVRVELERSGGFGGLRPAATVLDSRQLVCDDRGLPPQARPLVERVAAEGRPRP
jgi:hypothetical protein